ncbi:DUF4134 family protein [Flavitalea flava]
MRIKLSGLRMPKLYRLPIIFLFFLSFLFFSVILNAQDGNAGLAQANTMIRSYYQNAVEIMYGVSALLAIVGAIRVYSVWGHDGKQAQQAAIGWFGASIFIATVSTVIKSFYGI